MNTILFMTDTFRHDNLSCYGPTVVRTPRLDAFAQRAHVFDNAYLGSFPTLPNRLDIMSGRFSCIDHHWCPLPKSTVVLQQLLSSSGCVTQMVVDNPHLMEAGFNYERGFEGWEWVRGQETDLWKTSPRNVRFPADPAKLRSPNEVLVNHLRNSAWWQSEEDRCVARTVKAACNWLQENQELDQFFLYVDTFDPHEPWDAPQSYVDLYDPGYHGNEVNYPIYGYWREFMTESELAHSRALYMAEASLVDHWFGVLLDKLDELGMTEDTAIIFTSDHGFLFGEHDVIGKSLMNNETAAYESLPMYDELRRVPLLVGLPGQRTAARHKALAQSPDLMPTILELAGVLGTDVVGGEARTQALQCGFWYNENWVFDPERLHGKSLVPVLRGQTDRVRDIAVSSCTLIHHTPVMAKASIVTEDGWCLHYSGSYGQSIGEVQLLGSHIASLEQARAEVTPALYRLADDPGESVNLIHSDEALAREIHARYVGWLEEIDTPAQNIAGRRKIF